MGPEQRSRSTPLDYGRFRVTEPPEEPVTDTRTPSLLNTDELPVPGCTMAPTPTLEAVSPTTKTRPPPCQPLQRGSQPARLTQTSVQRGPAMQQRDADGR
ncbi:MAG: hypothetical protein IPG51_13015 [Chloroflexi bacterium]|nr:hypothetical protein [Chloroflexota bacterium]